MNTTFIIIICILGVVILMDIISNISKNKEISYLNETLLIYKFLVSFIATQIRNETSDETTRNILINAAKRMGNMEGISLSSPAEVCAEEIFQNSIKDCETYVR